MWYFVLIVFFEAEAQNLQSNPRNQESPVIDFALPVKQSLSKLKRVENSKSDLVR